MLPNIKVGRWICFAIYLAFLAAAVILFIIFYPAKPCECENVCVSEFDYEQYFERSILKILRDKNGSFDSEINAIYINESGHRIFDLINATDAYSFEKEIGKLNFKVPYNQSEFSKMIYMNNEKKIYSVDLLNDHCQYCKNQKCFDGHLNSFWNVPNDFVFESNETRILGLNFLLFGILDYYEKDNENGSEKIECQHVNQRSHQTRCTIRLGDNANKIEYLFRNFDQQTMYPISITYDIVGIDLGYKKRLDYLKFEISFKSNEIDFADLLTGLHCKLAKNDS